MGDFGRQVTAQRLCRGAASVALATAALVVGAAPAGAHGGDTDKVHGCINGSGQLKIVAAGGSCVQNDIPLDWAAVDTDTTYSAGSGLALSGANEFSVTGAPWTGLTGVPPGFADGVDDVGAAVDMKSDDATGPKQPNDGDGFVHWNNLESVPAGFADGIDDDGSSKVTELKTQLAANDSAPNATNDLVSFSKMKDLAGAITSEFIRDESIEGLDIANGTIFSADIADGGVTSLDIFDGTVEKRDLAAGVLDRQVTTLGVNPQEAPAGSRVAVQVTMPSASVSPADLVTVSPSATLEDDLLFAGSDVLAEGVVTIYLHNLSGTPVDGAERTWTIRRLRTGG